MRNKKTQEIITWIGTVGIVVFKLFIFATVLIVLSPRSWITFIPIILLGVIWVLGISNLQLIYLILIGERNTNFFDKEEMERKENEYNRKNKR